MRIAIAIALFALPTIAQAQEADASKADEKKLEGQWKVVELTFFGERAPNAQTRDLFYVFHGGKWQQKSGGKIDKHGTLRINAGAAPKTIDLVDQRGEKLMGVYRLKGKKLTICASLPLRAGAAQKRPTEFASTKANGYALIALERVEKGAK